MDLEILNKLYLELSQITTAKTANDLRLERISDDAITIGKLVLLNEKGEMAEICSGLTQDFKNNISSFEIKFKEGRQFLVSIKITETEDGFKL